MNPAQIFHADLNTTGQLAAFFAAAAVTAALLSLWSTLTRTARTVTDWARGRR
jgi:hypothetical protein